MVLQGLAGPSLLETYTSERGQTAQDLIDFDRKWTKMFVAKNQTDPAEFYENFIKAQKYTAGISTTYRDSIITSAERSTQSLATNLIVGMRVPSAQIVRLCDAKPIQLPKALPADGRWRIVVFAGDVGEDQVARGRVHKVNNSQHHFVVSFTDLNVVRRLSRLRKRPGAAFHKKRPPYRQLHRDHTGDSWRP